MSTVIIPKRRQERRNTAAALAALNEVLLDGEWCIETDTGKTKLGDGATAYNSLRYLDTNLFAVASGADTITATFASKPVLYDGLTVYLRAAGANTGAVTFNPNSLGALAVTKTGGTALVAGDIVGAGHELILRYRSSVPRWELLNPGVSASIADDAVTNAKLANMAASTIKARKTASTGDPEDCTLSEVLDLIGSAAQGDVLYRGASGWARLGAGTSGHFLKTLGAGANPAWAAASGGSGAMTYVGSASVTGSAATTLTISGLNLASDGRYYVELILKNATATGGFVRLFYNADTTTTNYDYASLFGPGIGAAYQNLAQICYTYASTATVCQGWITNDFDSKPRSRWLSTEGNTTGLVSRFISHMWRTASNVTSITLSHDVANALAIGTTIRIWKIT